MTRVLKDRQAKHPGGGHTTLSTAAGHRGFRSVLAKPSANVTTLGEGAQAHVDWHHDDHQNSHSDEPVKN